MKTIDLLRQIAGRLRPVSGEDAMFESKLMLASLLDTTPSALVTNADTETDDAFIKRLDRSVSQRESGYPIQYILGEWEFMGLPFFTDPCALIPRADTEILAEAAIKAVREKKYRGVLDLCTGTGCVGISVARISGAEITLCDISQDCCELARANARRNGICATVLQGDMFAPLEGKKFDLILSNPPYIPTDVIGTLQREVSFEPELALDGGRDGLDFYRIIAGSYSAYLNPGGMLMMEIGYDQAESVPRLFGGGDVLYDYGGNPRVVTVSPDNL